MKSERMKEFLKEDLKKLKIDIKENNKEEIESFFFYWDYHLKNLLTKNK